MVAGAGMTHDRDILVLDQVGHRFGGFTVLRSVTFSVPEGGIVGLIGPNGSGKTTLFNIISGYLALQAGSITYGGRALTTQSVQDRSRAGMVRTFQTPKIFERMTVLENIMVGACKITRTGILQDLVRSPHAQRTTWWDAVDAGIKSLTQARPGIRDIVEKRGAIYCP